MSGSGQGRGCWREVREQAFGFAIDDHAVVAFENQLNFLDGETAFQFLVSNAIADHEAPFPNGHRIRIRVSVSDHQIGFAFDSEDLE